MEQVAFQNNARTITSIREPSAAYLKQQKRKEAKLRVCAYCRVSTKDKEQLTSYEQQIKAYTQLITETPNWILVDIYADEGLTGTAMKKRDELNAMLEACYAGKIDHILVKSISRFARNTVDCIATVRELKEIGVSIYFEKENIDTRTASTEMFLSIYAAFAQAESESISANVAWGKRKAAKDGKVNFQYKKFLGYRKGADGNPEIIPDAAKTVQNIYYWYLSGKTVGMIKSTLENANILSPAQSSVWSTSSIRSILKNEKYTGLVILQKTFTENCISKKAIKNEGQLDKIIIENNHPAIISKDLFDKVQQELSRRSVKRSESVKSKTNKGRKKRSILAELMVCGECSSAHRKKLWVTKKTKRHIWRCVNRLENGEQFCHAPAIDEKALKTAIVAALNDFDNDREEIYSTILESLRPTNCSNPLHEIATAKKKIQQEQDTLSSLIRESSLAENRQKDYQLVFKECTNSIQRLTLRLSELNAQLQNQKGNFSELDELERFLKESSFAVTAYDEELVGRLIKRISVLDENTLLITFKGGYNVEQRL